MAGYGVGDRGRWQPGKAPNWVLCVVTVHAPGSYAAVAVAQAVVSDALGHQVPAPATTRAETAVVRRLH